MPLHTNRRLARGSDYATHQRQRKTDQFRCINTIFSSDKDCKQSPGERTEQDLYGASCRCTATLRPISANQRHLAVTQAGGRLRNYTANTGSPYPDVITARQLRAIPLGVLTGIFNIIIYSEKLFAHVRDHLHSQKDCSSAEWLLQAELSKQQQQAFKVWI